jgi:hypothetical protein
MHFLLLFLAIAPYFVDLHVDLLVASVIVFFFCCFSDDDA